MNTSINHIGLYVKNLERSKGFYEKYFGGAAGTFYDNGKGFSSYFLTFLSGARLELMTNVKQEPHTANALDTGFSHICFSVGSEENVDLLTDEIEKDGFTVYSAPRRTGDGYYESEILDPDGNFVEISV